MHCIRISVPNVLTRIGNICLRNLGLKREPKIKVLEISAPFDFKEGPAVNFPGYSEDDISLMREKAIASTAVVEDGEFDFASRVQQPRSLAGSHTCGLGSRMVRHVRKISRGYLPPVS